MRKFLFVLFSFCIVKNSHSQISGNVNADKNLNYNNTGYVSPPVNLQINNYSSSFSSLLEANVMINIKADSYVAIFSLSQFGKTVEEAEAAMNARAAIFTSMLKQYNIGTQQIFIDPVTMVPTYETEIIEKKLSKTFNEVPTGFEMKKNVHISFKEQSQINDIISIAAKAEVYDLVKVDYIINNKDEVLNQLRNEALRILFNKKEVLEKAGLFVRFNNVGEMNGTAFPVERYSQYYAFKSGTPPYVINESKKKAIPVTYNYADKNKTIFYDKVDDKQFDKVINPNVVEPVVQVYFSLKAQYSFYDPERELADKIYNEKLRELKIKDLEAELYLKRNPQLTVVPPKQNPLKK